MIEALFWFIFGGLSFVTVLFVWVACVVAGDTDVGEEMVRERLKDGAHDLREATQAIRECTGRFIALAEYIANGGEVTR